MPSVIDLLSDVGVVVVTRITSGPRSIAKILACAAMFVLAGVAQAGPQLSLTLNQPAFSPGDLFALTLVSQAGSPPADNTGDLYLAVQVPRGSLFFFEGTSFLLAYDGVNVFPNALVPFRANTTVAGGSETLFSGQITQLSPLGPTRSSPSSCALAQVSRTQASGSAISRLAHSWS